ncbi:phage terminase small subunit [Streptomyces sp. NPDC001705]
MAGRGPAPKDSRRRAGHRKDPHPQTTLRFEQAEAPELPTLRVRQGDEMVTFEWPEATREWWAMWQRSPQAEHFSSTDWSFLLDTALVHARHWNGEAAAGPELRLRVAKFGATPEDRARLRMQFAQADEADSKRPAGASSSERFADLKVIEGGGEDAVEGA